MRIAQSLAMKLLVRAFVVVGVGCSMPNEATAVVPFDLVPTGPWISCEFFLDQPHARWTLERFQIFAQLKPQSQTHHNAHATSKAWAAFGLPPDRVEDFILDVALGVAASGARYDVMVRESQNGIALSSLKVHVPPLLVWKNFHTMEIDDVTLDYTLNQENPRDLAIGSVSQHGTIRRYLAFSIAPLSDNLKLTVGLDVPCEAVEDYTPRLAHHIVGDGDQLFCRVELLSSWLK